MNHPITMLGDNNFEFAKAEGEDMWLFYPEHWLVIFGENGAEIIETVSRGTRRNCDERI